ncbi:MAG: sigma-70 family RNA polymerase sigma factor [Clostridia bacterium]|nr:sigma-70 family RNA polymerase sigma factor [Clostridia bacterium]
MQKIRAEKKKFDKIIKLMLKDRHVGTQQFYNEYAKLIYLVAKNFGCAHDKANFVVDTVLIKVWRRAGSLFNIENPIGWIITVAKNCAKDELNEIWHLELNENICATEDCFEQVDSKDSFEYLISCLDEEEKNLMSMRFSRRSSFQEIADSLEKPLPTTTSMFYRALQKIKKFIKNKNFE